MRELFFYFEKKTRKGTFFKSFIFSSFFLEGNSGSNSVKGKFGKLDPSNILILANEP